MTIVKSDSIEGELTHWLKNEHAPLALKGEFILQKGTISNKPRGLWLSWTKGWEEWCKVESFGDLPNKTCLHAQLNPGLDIWLIDSMDDFLEVWGDFKGKKAHIKDYPTMNIISLYESNFWQWLKDTKNIDGVALTDKGQCATRMRTWLYGWDCASIVIFNPDNVILKEENK